MQALTREDLYSLEEYAARREVFRAEVMEHKKNRQAPLGPNATLYFEDRLTMQYQVQEMLRIERIFEPEAIEEELATYNPLIPDGGNWKATFMLEYADIDERREALAGLLGIEKQVWVQVENFGRVYPIANEDLERETEEKTSAVHFLRFELTPEMVAAVKAGADIAMGIDHPDYRCQIDAVPANVRDSLAGDLWMARSQSAILPESGSAGLFLVLRVAEGDAATREVVRRCAGLEQMGAALVDEAVEGEPAPALRASVAFGADFWDRLSPHSRPALLKRFKPLRGAYDAPATGGDVFIHLHSLRPDLNFELAKRLLEELNGSAKVLEEVHGFRYLDSRDLTGFIDGTENPEGGERAQAALIGDEDPEFAGGSYVLTQRYVHNLQQWETVPVSEQEGVIGRTKPDSMELRDAVKPETAHISRVVIEEDGEELEILRHSMPYGRVSDEAGLFFVAYGRELPIFEKMLDRMFGVVDGPSDRLLDFTTPVSGAFFFAPSRRMLEKLAT